MDLARYRARVLDSYALVSYLPEPIGSFFNQLSRQLVPDCRPKSLITLLPPRHLSGSVEEAKATLASVTGSLQPFELEITTIEIFDATSVIYADIGEGRDRLLSIHVDLNVDALAYQEQFAFHPHVTLAIHANSENIHALVDEARLEWAAYPGERRFQVEHLHFVHNVAPECWEDIASYTLVAPSPFRGR
ncbi:MAG: 2'-5' RNA ligase family protein [Bryobacterales bacterium]|nr:2'-5' RNA ligase family protein [Bryobacterales bacterium]